MSDDKSQPLSDLEIEIPAKFSPNGDTGQIAAKTSLPRLPLVQARNIGRAFKKLQMQFISTTRLRDLAALGVELSPATMLNFSKSGTLVAQQGVLKAFTDLMQIHEAATERAKVKMAAQIGFLAGKLTVINKQMDESARKEIPKAAQTANVQPRAFVPHVMIQVNEAKPGQVKVIESVTNEP